MPQRKTLTPTSFFLPTARRWPGIGSAYPARGNGDFRRNARRATSRPAASPETSSASWQRAWKGDGYIYALVGRDAQEVLGVGSEGMILSSVDGGESWHYQAPLPEYDLHDLSMVGLNLWAVGQNGTILYSGDGGVSWRQQNIGLTTDLQGVHFLNASDGWAVGASGLIVHSSDGGASWGAQNSGVTTDLQAIRMFADGLHGVAVGAAGTLLTSADGGSSWSPHAGLVPDWVTLHDVHVEGANAWVVGDGDHLLVSSNQGASWSVKKVGTNEDLLEVEFASGQSQIGWVAGRDGGLARTSDGGANWPWRSSGDPGYDSAWTGRRQHHQRLGGGQRAGFQRWQLGRTR